LVDRSIIRAFLDPPATPVQHQQSLATFARSKDPMEAVAPLDPPQLPPLLPTIRSRRHPPHAAAPQSNSPSNEAAGIEVADSSATPAPRRRKREGLWYAGPSRFLMCVTTHKRKSLCPCKHCNGKGLCVHKLQKHRYALVWCVFVCVCYSLIPSPGAKPAEDRVSACTGKPKEGANCANSSKTGGATTFAG